MTLLDSDRPTGLGLLQAYAAIGQAELIQQYNREFEKHGKRAAQVLLTIDDMDDRQRYLNLRNTFISLFELGAIPVINENDCVATEEISVTFGDNDRLAANVAMLVDADLLIILSDVDALYDRNPRETDACRIGWVEQLDDRTRKAAVDPGGEGRSFSKGGMSSKMEAAAMAASVGIPTLIAGGHVPDILEKIMAGEEQGTLFAASGQNTNSRKRWIRSAIEVTGNAVIDQGAERAVCHDGKSLLPIGVVKIEGHFAAGDLITVSSTGGQVIARGISNFDHREAQTVRGLRSEQVLEKLGRVANEELIHRDNLVLV